MAALRRGEKIDLRGACSSLDFDLATGEPDDDYAIECPAVTGDEVADARESGIVYRARNGTVEGVARCLK
jgi:hypothetical protein